MTRADHVKYFVQRRLEYLAGMGDGSRQKALLAQLRRGIGKKPGEIPELWGVLFQGMPEEMMSRSGEPTPEENAVYTALTLYAYHQQGKDPAADNMNVSGLGIGRAVASLVEREEETDRVQNRFNRFATAADLTEASTHLRGLVSLLRNKGIGLDYPQLARELYTYQFYDGAKNVRLAWGQDFYRYLLKNKEEK